MLYQLIYRSRVARKVRFADVEAIAEAAAVKNAEVRVSGILLYTPTYFLQVLEGEKDAVETTYARIFNDPRHDDVTILKKSEIVVRQFGEWNMRAVMPSSELTAALLDPIDLDSALALLVRSR
jgi:Sensors of blue-light using FAD